MKNRILWILALNLLLLVSCSIEKKHYSRGYHIEWKHVRSKNISTDTNEEIVSTELNTEIKTSSEEVIIPSNKQNTLNNTEVEQENINGSKMSKQRNVIDKAETKEIYSPKITDSEIKSQTLVPVVLRPEGKQKIVDPLAIFSNIFVIAGLLIATLTSAPIFIGFALPFIGFIFGIISMVHISMNEGKYRGLALAIIGTFCALIVLTIVLLMVLI